MSAVLVGATIEIGVHPVVHVFGLTMNRDTLTGTAVAMVVVIGLGLALRRSATKEVPGKLQLFWELVVGTVQRQVESSVGVAAGPAVPLAATLFVFILVCNWVEVIPTFGFKPTGGLSVAREFAPAPTGDVNLVYAMALVVFVVYTVASFRAHGFRGFFGRFARPYKFLLPINVIEQIAQPITLALRLFGNIFSGGLMVTLLALLPAFLSWLPTAVWKAFDMFIGLIQAFIFALLTILYYGAAVSREGH